MKKKTLIKIIFLIIFIVITLTSIKFLNLYEIYKSGSLSDEFSSFKGTVLFIILNSIRPIFIILPALPMNIAAGGLWDPFYALIIVFISFLVSGTVGFYFARFMGKEFVDKIKNPRIIKIKTTIEKCGWAAVISLNYTGIPWDIVSIGSGLSKMTYFEFLVGIAISGVPLTFIAVYFGYAVFSKNVTQTQFIIIAIIFISGIVLPHVIRKKLKYQCKV
ncbi:MAG: VTT domain-containing protein [Nanoarchaeota archaeon]